MSTLPNKICENSYDTFDKIVAEQIRWRIENIRNISEAPHDSVTIKAIKLVAQYMYI